nr:MAG TPA: hypothetical protein [Caudoviricetes sp.]
MPVGGSALDFRLCCFDSTNPRCSVWSIGGFYLYTIFQALMRIFPCGRFSFLSFVVRSLSLPTV